MSQTAALLRVTDSARVSRQPVWVWTIAGAMASGLLMAACYWPLDWHWLAWVAWVPWLVVLPRVSPAGAWLGGTLVGLVFYRLGLTWAYGLLGPFGTVLIVGLAAWMGFAFRVARMLMERFGPAAMLWAVPLAFVGQEVLRCEGHPQYRFAFLALGYSQSHNLWIAQIASLGGVYFITFVLVALNAAVAYGLTRRRRRAWMPAAFEGLAILGLAIVSQPPAYDALPRVPVACLQAENARRTVYQDLIREAAQANPQPVLVALPEHTLEDVSPSMDLATHWLAQAAREHGVYVSVGADLPASRDAACYFDNVALLFGPDGRAIHTQRKAVPIPFFQDGNPATQQTLAETPLGRVGSYVCYDGTFTDVPRRLAALGAELLIGPVMDPQRWPVQERWQHAAMAPLRSIELRRCQVRAASSGVSQISDATGRVTAHRTRDEGPGVLRGEVYLVSGRTPFVRAGHWLATAAGWGFLAAVAWLTARPWFAGLHRRVRIQSIGPTPGRDLAGPVRCG